MSFTYREAIPEDAQALLEYNKIVGAETNYLSFGSDTFNISVESEARFISRFINNRKNLMLVALDGESIVANASIERNRILRYSHRAELSITVMKEYWGCGIGSELMRRLIDFCRDSEAEVVYLDVRADNLRAKRLYNKFGFTSIGTFKRYFKIDDKYYDAELMTLELF